MNNDNFSVLVEKEDKTTKKLKIAIFSLLVLLVGFIAAIAIVLLSNQSATRTFMIYMVGADLESRGSMATYELDGIDPKKVDLENMNVVLLAGGAKEWNNDYIDEEETSIYELTKNGFEKVKTQDIRNMGESETLSDFINYTTDNYKTAEYELLFWNHGGAIDGSEYDELSRNDNLSLLEISEALESTNFNANNKLNTVIFSTCLNGTIENANIFRDYADYYVASEEVSLSIKNQSDFSFINDVTLETPNQEIGKAFIGKYKDKIALLRASYAKYNEDYTVYSTYSLVDLNELTNLNTAVDEFFGDINVAENYNAIAKIRNNLYQYAYEQADDPSYDMVDLYNLINELRSFSPDKADKALKQFEKTVIYNYSTDESSRGISIYFPYNAKKAVQNMFLSTYDEISNLKNYNKFITDFNSVKTTASASRLPYDKNEVSVTSTADGADFKLVLSDEQLETFAEAEYLVFRDNHDSTYRPVYKGIDTSLDGNTLYANIKDRQLVIKDLDPEEDVNPEEYGGGLLTLFESEVTDTYIKYTTNVILTGDDPESIIGIKMDGARIGIVLNRETGEVSLGEAILLSSEDMIGGAVLDLNDYNTIGFATSSYNVFNSDGSFNENWTETSDGVITGWECELDSCDFTIEDYDSEQDYYSVFKIKDINGNIYYSDLLKLD